MRRLVTAAMVLLAAAGAAYTLRTAMAADAAKPAAVDYTTIKPADLVAKTPKGQLKNPYQDTQADVVAQGEHLFLSYSCNGCHGGGGGGGMAAPLTNPIWVYGDDDDTLFRLIVLGTGKLSPGDAFGKLGYKRKGSESVVGPMPHFGEILKTEDDVWKIIAWIRSVYCGRRPSGC